MRNVLSDKDKKFITNVIDTALQAANKEISLAMVGTLPDGKDTYAVGTSDAVVVAALQPDAGTSGVREDHV